MNTGPCRGIGCDATIGWVKTTAGKMMPVDLEPKEAWLDVGAASGPSARVTLISAEGVMVTGQPTSTHSPRAQLVRGFTPHWSRCPAAVQWKKAVRRQEPSV